VNDRRQHLRGNDKSRNLTAGCVISIILQNNSDTCFGTHVCICKLARTLAVRVFPPAVVRYVNLFGPFAIDVVETLLRYRTNHIVRGILGMVWVKTSRSAPIEKGNVVSSAREARSYFPNIIPEFELRFFCERDNDSAHPCSH